MDLKSPETTEKYLQALIKYDKWQEEERSQQRTTTSVNHKKTTPKQQYNYSPQQHQPHYPTQGSPQPQPNNSEKRYDGCWSCGDMDHYQYQCSKNY